MTDKQIIIDEINVKEYTKAAFELAKETLTEKDQLKEYYDKLLLRKEQECEELKSDLTDLSKIIDCKNGTILTFKQQLDQLKAENDTLFKAIEEVNKINKRFESENEELKRQLESTKGLLTVGNKQLAESLLELQKYKDNEQQEKEIQKLYNKFEGSSLIDYKNK